MEDDLPGETLVGRLDRLGDTGELVGSLVSGL